MVHTRATSIKQANNPLRTVDLYDLAKVLGNSNVKMTERYEKLARQHIARTVSTAREIWKRMEICDMANIG